MSDDDDLTFDCYWLSVPNKLCLTFINCSFECEAVLKSQAARVVFTSSLSESFRLEQLIHLYRLFWGHILTHDQVITQENTSYFYNISWCEKTVAIVTSRHFSNTEHTSNSIRMCPMTLNDRTSTWRSDWNTLAFFFVGQVRITFISEYEEISYNLLFRRVLSCNFSLISIMWIWGWSCLGSLTSSFVDSSFSAISLS